MATSERNLSAYDPGTIPPAGDLRIALVVSEWNEQVTGRLAEGARETLIHHGVKPENLLLRHVPGSFELPLGGRILIDQFHPDAVILIGCVIRGETPHFDFISQAVAQGCMQLGLETGIPVIFG
ncbi:MAG: 6,7-dimethyl-8-ribityllumazine synthase, partial [Bacteroidales bacterium]